MLDRNLTIQSPEQIQFQIPLAGLGTRFFAMLIDFMIVFFGLIVVGMILRIVGLSFFVFTRSALWSTSLTSALMYLAAFLLQWGYFIFFEMYWNGQTPGKKFMKIRVLRSDGGAITLYQSTIRNLLRIVDALPMFVPIFYAVGNIVGLTAIFLSRENRRLGDLVAGTVVVRQVEWRPPRKVHPTWSQYNTFREDPRLRRRLQVDLNKDAKELILDLSLRADQLELKTRLRLMEALSLYLEKKVRLARPDFMSPEKFINNLAGCLYADEEEAARKLERSGKKTRRAL